MLPVFDYARQASKGKRRTRAWWFAANLLLLIAVGASAQLTYFDADVTGYEVTDKSGSAPPPEITFLNQCGLSGPIYVDVQVLPYLRAGATSPRLTPTTDTISVEVAPGELTTIKLNELQAEHAEIRVRPGTNTRAGSSCFSPGRQQVHYAIASYRQDGSIGKLVQGLVSPTKDNENARKPEKVVVVGSKVKEIIRLIPPHNGEQLHFGAINTCPDGRPQNAKAILTDGENLSETLINVEAGERLEYSIDSPDSSGADGWTIFSVETDTTAGCDPAGSVLVPWVFID